MIEVKNLSKVFKYKDKKNQMAEKTAVDNLSLDIKAGEIFGLLGPNGSGKTTTIRMLTMLLKPTTGEIFYDGRHVDIDDKDVREVKQMFGIVPQNLNFDMDLTVRENMELHGRLYHMNRKDREERIAELLKYVGVEEVINDKVRNLSGGMKRRVLIARALMHNPRILFMDEPTVALDPQVRRRIWELIRQLANKGTTVLITTHYIEEAEELCDRVAIVNHGKLLDIDTPKGFISRLGRYVVEWTEGTHKEFKLFNSREEAGQYLTQLDAPGGIRKSNLEDVFIEMTGRKEGL
ncbi:MAG: ABC transporter ATP-binding protein [Schwartzia succinivorans]|jgi:ABC-2 type transport system ATP-binding protein|uniref:ABC transporter ATP-binding protein n=1 Tax=Schwartzia succinivorans TaxID=55507 RepID=UPI002356A726|nr:ABC transporter ATP-binding protein [Schwartzia succinivorans]MBE6097787.1 ABC transporter ATP-binding protein [Schwartzia succinivorans]